MQAGELLRQERAKGTEDGKLIDEYLVQGKIVPVRISLGLLRREMAASKATRFLVDGFPRNFDNVKVRACRLWSSSCVHRPTRVRPRPPHRTFFLWYSTHPPNHRTIQQHNTTPAEPGLGGGYVGRGGGGGGAGA